MEVGQLKIPWHITHSMGSFADGLFQINESGMIEYFAKLSAQAVQLESYNIVRESVTRFLGRDDFAIDEVINRATLLTMPSGIEVLCMDGVRLLELYPAEVEQTRNDRMTMTMTIEAKRRYRFLV